MSLKRIIILLAVGPLCISLAYQYRIGERWAVVAAFIRFQGDGNFRYYQIDFSYRIGGGFVASIGYQLTDMDATRKQSRPRRRSEYDLEFSGTSIHLSYGF